MNVNDLVRAFAQLPAWNQARTALATELGNSRLGVRNAVGTSNTRSTQKLMKQVNLIEFYKTYPGWRQLVEPLAAACKARGYTILAVENKYGGMRFFWMNPHLVTDPGLEVMVRIREDASYRTCMKCGKEGRLFGEGTCDRGNIFETLCKEHEDDEFGTS